MTKGFIAYFCFARTTSAGYEGFDLELAHGDNTFDWVARIPDGKGGTTTKRARGRWSQTGDAITLVIEHADPSTPLPTRLIERGQSLDVEGFGQFWMDR